MQSEAPSSPPGSSRLESVLNALLIAGSLGLFFLFALPFLAGRLYIEDDLAALYLPVRDFYSKCLANGYNFLWMPHLANGFYIHGEGHGGFLHPLHYVLYRFFPLDRAFMLELLISYPVMYLGMYFFLRRWTIERPGALFGALLMTFIGCSMNHYVHISFVGVMAHLPWALLAIDTAMKSVKPARATFGIAAVILLSASQLYLGNPQVTYFSWLIEGLYALFLLGLTRRIPRLLQLGVAKALAIAIGAAQLLPTLAAYQASMRHDPTLEYQLGISLHPWNLFQMVSPYLFHGRVYTPLAGDEPWDAPYMGTAMVPLLLLLFVAWPKAKPQRALAWAALALAVFALLAMLGKYGFLYHVLNHIPVVNFFRAPARYVAVFHVALAVLGGLGFATLYKLVLRDGPEMRGRFVIIFLLPVTLGGAVWLIASFGPVYSGDEAAAALQQQIMRPHALAAGTFFIALVPQLMLISLWGRRYALVLVVLLSFADIGLYSLRHKPSEALSTILANIPTPPGDNRYRIEPNIVPYTMNQVAMQGYRSSTGYLNLFPEIYLDYAQPVPMQLAGVRWRESRLGTSPELHAAKEADIEWIELDNPMPRARLVPDAVVSADPMADLTSIDIETTALVFDPVTLDGGNPGSADLGVDVPGHIAVRTGSDGAELLVVSENFHEGWRATLDGEPAPILRAYGDFLGVVVPGGNHDVVFRFWPAHVTRGLIVSGGALALSIAYIVLLAYLGSRSHRRPGAGGDGSAA